MWGKTQLCRQCSRLNHAVHPGLVKSGYGQPVKRLADDLIPLCPPHTLWHWALRSWRYLSVGQKDTAGSSSGKSASPPVVRLRPGSFPEIKDWDYAGAEELAKLSLAKGMQSSKCYMCEPPVMVPTESRSVSCRTCSLHVQSYATEYWPSDPPVLSPTGACAAVS